MTLRKNDTKEQLLASFNKRDERAFGIVFRMLYKELYLYASRLFNPLNIPPEDIIQDIFIDIWSRKSVQFTSISYIKTFCFIALKNAYKNKIKHLNQQQRYELECKADYEFSENLKLVELYNSLHESLKLLPDDYATIIRMYLEGWKPEEIAKKLELALQTVYNKRREAVILLRKYMAK